MYSDLPFSSVEVVTERAHLRRTESVLRRVVRITIVYIPSENTPHRTTFLFFYICFTHARDSDAIVTERFYCQLFCSWNITIKTKTIRTSLIYKSINHFFRCVGLLINTNQCFFMRNYTELMRVLAFVRVTLLIRICVDPILSFVTDFQVR